MRTKILTIVVSFFILGVGLFFAKRLLETPPTAQKIAPQKKSILVETTTFNQGTNKVIFEAISTIYPKALTPISSQVSGKLVYINPKLKTGAFFKENELLFRIESSDYEANLMQKESEFKKANAALEIAKAEHEVAKKEYMLIGQKLKAEDEKLALKIPQLLQAEANLESAKANLLKAQLELKRCEIRAPFDGVITEYSASIGMIVNSGTQLAKIAESLVFYADFEVDEKKLELIPKDAKAKVALLESNTFIDAQVANLIPVVDNKTKQAKLLIEIPKPLEASPPLLIGSVVKIKVIGKEIENSVLIPMHLIRGESNVWIKEKDSLKIKPIKIINEQDKHVLTTSIDLSDEVITTNLNSVFEGMSITTKESLKRIKE